MKKRALTWVAENRLLALSLSVSVVVAVAVLVVALLLGSWLTGTGPGEETGSTTIRNLGILFAALVALPLAVWRAQVADEQATAAREQAEAADRQAETAQADLRNKRYQDSAAMLGSEVLAVRLAGIYALERLAQEHPQEHHIEVMKLLCACLRHPSKGWESVPVEAAEQGGGSASGGRLGGWLAEQRADAEAALNAISNCHGRQLELEHKAEFRLDLRKADFRGTVLPAVNLSDAQLGGSHLVDVLMVAWDLTDADLVGADLTDAKLRRANLKRARLIGAKLTGADFTGSLHFKGFARPLGYPSSLKGMASTGLTQAQLDHANADPDEPPNLDGVRDTKTGKQLVWRGRTLDGGPHPNPPPIPDA